MDDKIILRIWGKCFLTEPDAIERCAVGQGNYVYIVVCGDKMYVLRCSEEKGAYEDTVRWLNQLSAIGVPVPAVIAKGYCEAWEYLVLSYLEGQDIGLVYSGLSREEKKKIATEVVDIQRKVSVLKLDGLEMDWSWTSFVEELLDRAEKRIEQNGYFEVEKVERIRHQMWVLEEYFTSVKPIAYLDDISPYDNVFVCGPCWWGTFPMAVVSQLERLDFTGRKVFAVMTHEGSGLGGSERTLKQSCRGATFGKGLAIYGAEAPRSEAVVAAWAKKCV